MKPGSQAPNLTHANATSICAMALKAMALDAKRGADFRDGYDFLVDGTVRLAVRYAIPTADREQTYRKRNGELSRYVYKRWTFNFHRHGTLGERYCDFFVCFLASPEQKGRSASDVTVFVIPWEAITGLTFCSSVREGSTRAYRGKYAKYRDAWSLIAAAVAQPRVPREEKVLRISSDSRRRLRLIARNAQSTDGMSGADDFTEATAIEDRTRKERTPTTRPSGEGA